MNKRILLTRLLHGVDDALEHLQKKATDKMLASMTDAELDAHIKHLETELAKLGVDPSKLIG